MLNVYDKVQYAITTKHQKNKNNKLVKYISLFSIVFLMAYSVQIRPT